MVQLPFQCIEWHFLKLVARNVWERREVSPPPPLPLSCFSLVSEPVARIVHGVSGTGWEEERWRGGGGGEGACGGICCVT